MSNPHNLSPSVFHFEESADVRVIVKEGEPWFVAKDVLGVLRLSNTTEALRNLDDDERCSEFLNTSGGRQNCVIINESGLYALVIRSNKPSARKFRKWITSEVLPAIRKTGRYVGPETDKAEAAKVAAQDVPWFKAEGTYCGVPVMTSAALAQLLKVNCDTVFYRCCPSKNRGILEDDVDLFRAIPKFLRFNGGFYQEKCNGPANLITESGARKLYRCFFGLGSAPHGMVPATVPAPPAAVPGVLLDLPRKGPHAAERPDLSVAECLEDTCVIDILEKLSAAGYDVDRAFVVASMTQAAVRHYQNMLENIRRSAVNGLTMSRFSLVRSGALAALKRA